MPRWIKKWIYKQGFRPNPNSIFYSPGLTWAYLAREMMQKEMDRSVQEEESA